MGFYPEHDVKKARSRLGAVEACVAHNHKDPGSKPGDANIFFSDLAQWESAGSLNWRSQVQFL